MSKLLLVSTAAAVLAASYTSSAHATACPEDGSFTISNVEVVVTPATDCLVVSAEIQGGCDDVLVVSVQNNCGVPLVFDSADFQCDPTAEEIEAHGGIADPIDCSTLPSGRVGTLEIPPSDGGPHERELLATLAADGNGEPTDLSIQLGYLVSESSANEQGCSVSSSRGPGPGSLVALLGAVCVGVAAALRRARR